MKKRTKDTMGARRLSGLVAGARLLLVVGAATFVLAGGSVAPRIAMAEEPAASASADEKATAAPASQGEAEQGATSFQPAAQQEQVSGLNLMVAAYIAIWLGLFGYFLTLLGRQRKLRTELTELRARIDELDERVQEKS